MNRLRDRVPDARHRADHVGARPQVGDLAQEFERMRLRLDRVGVRVLDPADDLDGACLHFERLALCRRGHDHARGFHRAAGRQAHHFVRIVGKRVGCDHLDGIERRAVGHVHE